MANDRTGEGDDALLRLRPGAQLGRYELVAVVASGGMGRVWAARAIGQHGFRRLVALKTILPTFAAVPEFEQRFLDEAKLAAQIHHPNVCQIDDLGEANRILYMALEWIDGAPLSELYRERAKGDPRPTPVDPRFAARIVAQVCAGLHAAHELKDEAGQSLGVVHRDVSPQNVLVGDSVVKVTDFGIAKALGRTHQTKAGEVRGKAPYLAPEQLTAQPVDRRTDVYAVGALLYEISTGERAFDGETDAQILVKVLNEAPLPPDDFIPGYPPALQSIVLRALSKRPTQRFASALEMQHALEKYLASQETLTDGAFARIVQERLGKEIQERRELVKRASTTSMANLPAAASSSASSMALSAEDLISDSASVPIGIANTAASALDLPPAPELGLPKGPPVFVAKPAKPPVPILKKVAPGLVPNKPAAPPVHTAPLSGSDVIDMPSSLISAEIPREAVPSPGFLDPEALRAARGNNAGSANNASILANGGAGQMQAPLRPESSPGFDLEASGGAPKIELENVDLMAVAENLRAEYEREGPRPKKVVVAAPKERKLWPLIVGGATALIVILGICTWAILPKYTAWKLTSAVAAAGLDASWSKLSVTTSAITLQDVSFRIPEIPAFSVSAKQVELTPLYAPKHAELRGVTITLDGPPGDLMAHAKVWGLAHPSMNDIDLVTLDDAHVEWPRVFADSHVLRADGAHVELTHSASVNKLAVTAPSTRLDGDQGSFGPWGVDLTADDSGTVMHAALDPSVPQEAAVSVTMPNDAPPSVTVHIQRTPLARLGIAPSILSLAPTDETQLEVEAQLAGSAPSRVRGDLKLTLHDARTKSMPVPIDIVVAANVNGDARDPLPLHVTQLVLGPLRAQADTLLDVSNGAFRIDGKWNATMPCARMADIASDAGFGLGSMTTPLGKLVKTATRTGDAVVSGLVTFDAQHLDHLRFAPTYAATCGIPLLTAAAAP